MKINIELDEKAVACFIYGCKDGGYNYEGTIPLKICGKEIKDFFKVKVDDEDNVEVTCDPVFEPYIGPAEYEEGQFEDASIWPDKKVEISEYEKRLLRVACQSLSIGRFREQEQER